MVARERNQRMKRNPELIRKILFEVEGQDGLIGDIIIPGYLPDVIGKHVHLMSEDGLIDAKFASIHGQSVPIYSICGLTSAGYDFLDAIRDDSKWPRLKEKILRYGPDAFMRLISNVGVMAAMKGLEGTLFYG